MLPTPIPVLLMLVCVQSKTTNDDVGLVSLPDLTKRATTPPTASRWETQAPMLRLAWEAAEQGNIARLRQLFQRGVQINDARKKNTTPLHVAAARGHTDVCVHINYSHFCFFHSSRVEL